MEQDSTRSSPHPLNRTLSDPVVGILFARSFVAQMLCYSCACTNATVLGSGLPEKASKFNDNAGDENKPVMARSHIAPNWDFIRVDEISIVTGGRIRSCQETPRYDRE